MRKILTITIIFWVFGFYFIVFAQESPINSPARIEARKIISGVLFGNVPPGTNQDYNDWRAPTDKVSATVALAKNNDFCSHSAKGGHPGIDIQTKDMVENTEVISHPFYALDNGTVVSSGESSLNTIAVFNSGTNKTTLYLHASNVLIENGSEVSIGTVLGVQGNAGLKVNSATEREHVHVEVLEGNQTRPLCGADNPANPSRKSVDPVNYLHQRIKASISPKTKVVVTDPALLKKYKKILKYARQGKRKSLRKQLEKFPEANLEYSDEKKRTALYWAAVANKIENLELLISKGGQVNMSDIYGWTPLHAAADSGHNANVKKLIESGADVNALNKKNISPLFSAVSKRHNVIAQMLLTSGAAPNIITSNKETPITLATYNGDQKMVKVLLDGGADKNTMWEGHTIRDIADGIRAAYKQAGWSTPQLWADVSLLEGVKSKKPYKYSKKVNPPPIKLDQNGRPICPSQKFVGFSPDEKSAAVYGINQQIKANTFESQGNIWEREVNSMSCWTKLELQNRVPFRGNTVLKIRVDVVWPAGYRLQCMAPQKDLSKGWDWDEFERQSITCNQMNDYVSGAQKPKPKGHREYFIAEVEI